MVEKKCISRLERLADWEEEFHLSLCFVALPRFDTWRHPHDPPWLYRESIFRLMVVDVGVLNLPIVLGSTRGGRHGSILSIGDRSVYLGYE